MPGYAEQNPTYAPAVRLITDITQAEQAVVTTSFSHGYTSGCIVRLVVPQWFGMVQVNNLFGPITVLSDTTFSIALDTRYYEPFSIPDPTPAYVNEFPQAVPIGEINSSLLSAVQNIL